MNALQYLESNLIIPTTPNTICKSLNNNEIYTGVFNPEKIFIAKIDGIFSICKGNICAINTWSTGIIKSLRFRVETYKYINNELNSLALLIEQAKINVCNYDELDKIIMNYELSVHNLFTIEDIEYNIDNSKRTIETCIFQNYYGVTTDVIKVFSSILDDYLML